MKQVMIKLFLLLFFVSCAPVANKKTITATQTAVLSNPTTQATQTPSPTNTAHPSFTPTTFPDYSNISPLTQLIITKKDVCLANYSLPVITRYRDVREIDLTSSTDPKYCMIDCARHRWSASDGASFTFTVVRLASPSATTTLLEEELDRVQQLYSDREKYIGFGFDDPYTGEGDSSWAGYPYPGFTSYSAVARSSILIIMEWTQVLYSFDLDLDFDFGMTYEFVLIQFEKIDNALGTPFPTTNNQSQCKH